MARGPRQRRCAVETCDGRHERRAERTREGQPITFWLQALRVDGRLALLRRSSDTICPVIEFGPQFESASRKHSTCRRESETADIAPVSRPARACSDRSSTRRTPSVKPTRGGDQGGYRRGWSEQWVGSAGARRRRAHEESTKVVSWGFACHSARGARRRAEGATSRSTIDARRPTPRFVIEPWSSHARARTLAGKVKGATSGDSSVGVGPKTHPRPGRLQTRVNRVGDPAAYHAPACPSGVTGKRGGLKIHCLTACGFESRLGHQIDERASPSRALAPPTRRSRSSSCGDLPADATHCIYVVGARALTGRATGPPSPVWYPSTRSKDVLISSVRSFDLVLPPGTNVSKRPPVAYAASVFSRRGSAGRQSWRSARNTPGNRPIPFRFAGFKNPARSS